MGPTLRFGHRGPTYARVARAPPVRLQSKKRERSARITARLFMESKLAWSRPELTASCVSVTSNPGVTSYHRFDQGAQRERCKDSAAWRSMTHGFASALVVEERPGRSSPFPRRREQEVKTRGKGEQGERGNGGTEFCWQRKRVQHSSSISTV